MEEVNATEKERNKAEKKKLKVKKHMLRYVFLKKRLPNVRFFAFYILLFFGLVGYSV